MITEDYVSVEVAKLLKEKGFDCECYGYYDTTKHPDYMLEHSGSEMDSNDGPDCYISAPTLQMAMKWLRKEHHLNIIVDCYTDHAEARIMTIEDLPACKCRGIIGEKYEKACDAAIKYCLENLI